MNQALLEIYRQRHYDRWGGDAEERHAKSFFNILRGDQKEEGEKKISKKGKARSRKIEKALMIKSEGTRR